MLDGFGFEYFEEGGFDMDLDLKFIGFDLKKINWS